MKGQIEKPKKYISVNDVRCPICDGVINKKWFNFRGKDTVEFIAECWSGDLNIESYKHVFYFQMDTPPCVLFDDEGKQFLADREDD